VLRRPLSAALATSTALAATAAAIGGCGEQRTRPPDVSTPAAWYGVQTVSLPAQGITFKAPMSWRINEGQAPLVAAVSSGRAIVAIWRYPRTEPLPTDAASMAQARDELIRATRGRDRHLRLIRARVTRFHGTHAVELAALEHIGNQLRRVRSLHVYAYGAEIVLDAYAPPSAFHAVDHAVFSPLSRTLRITRAAHS
jgi:hypothetical protein